MGKAGGKNPALLEFRGVHLGYGNIEVVHGIDLRVAVGEIVTLIGNNGAGKTTTLMSIFGQIEVTGGSIVYRGENLVGLPSHKIAARGIALVPEGRRVFPAMTVEENLLMGAVSRGSTAGELGADLRQVYEQFPIMAERRSQRAGTLSGGEQQMLAIGRALMARPSLLLLDEPSLGLAPMIIRQIFQALASIAKGGVTIFLVEQNANLALKISDRAYVLSVGKVTLSGKSSELLKRPEIKRAYLGEV